MWPRRYELKVFSQRFKEFINRDGEKMSPYEVERRCCCALAFARPRHFRFPTRGLVVAAVVVGLAQHALKAAQYLVVTDEGILNR
jgi:hypothetical protein